MKLKAACWWALAALPLIGLLTVGCFDIDGSKCGGLPVYLFLLPTAFVIHLFPMEIRNDALFWLIFAVVNWAWLTALIFFGSAIVPRRARPSRDTRRNHSNPDGDRKGP